MLPATGLLIMGLDWLFFSEEAAVSGDLREEFASLVSRRGQAAAARWYWRQALPLAARFTAGRVVPAITPPRRRRVAVADIERTSSLGAGWSRELRHAWRALWQRPALTTTIVATLALALAANAVVFNLADALYLRPLRFADVDRLIVVVRRDRRKGVHRPRVGHAGRLPRLASSITTATGLSAVEWWDPNLSGIDVPEQVAGFKVTPGFFETLGAQPLVGRTFGEAEGRPDADRAVVLSHTFWTRRFNANSGARRPDDPARRLALRGPRRDAASGSSSPTAPRSGRRSPTPRTNGRIARAIR